MIVILTYLDNITGVPVTEGPARNRPKLPQLEGVKVLWKKLSKEPTDVPEFVCEIAEGQNTDIPGVLQVLTSEENDTAYAEELQLRILKKAANEAEIYKNLVISETRIRNNLLQESDWTQTLDAPVDKVVWAAYRQQLRDVTSQPEFPQNIIWPIRPE